MDVEMTSPAPCRGDCTLIFSPHSDDAALSLGGIIQKKVLPQPVTLLTIFGRSNYLRETAFQPDWRKVTRLRREEDRAFASAAGLRWKFLELPEAGLRLGSSFDRIFSHQDQTAMPAPATLVAALQKSLDDFAPKLLFAPLGLGRHHDHLLVRELAGEHARRRGIETVYFEDLPYAAEYSEAEILKHAHQFNPLLRPTCVPITSELEAKLAALRLYESQIGAEELKAVSDHATRWQGRCAVERVWSSAFPLRLLDEAS